MKTDFGSHGVLLGRSSAQLQREADQHGLDTHQHTTLPVQPHTPLYPSPTGALSTSLPLLGFPKDVAARAPQLLPQ